MLRPTPPASRRAWWPRRLPSAAGALALGLLAAFGMAPAASAAAVPASPDLQALTEEWPPYNFTRDGVPAGIATDLLREVCDGAKLVCDIRVVPWARAMMIVRQTPSTLLFTTARTPEREAQFLWVGPFLPRELWVFERPEHPLHLTRIADLDRYRVGAVRGDASVADLLRHGVREDHLDYASSPDANLRKLMHDRLDAVTGTEIGAAWSLREFGLPPTTLRRTLSLSHGSGYYFAVNPGTPPGVVDRLRRALAELQRQHRVEALVKRYVQAP